MVRIAVCDDVKEMLGILTEIVDKEAGKLSEPYEISGFTQGKHLVEEHNKKAVSYHFPGYIHARHERF